METFEEKRTTLSSILEKGLEVEESRFISLLLNAYSIDELPGKSIKDKRGGENNIHSWDIGLKGQITKEQRALLNRMMRERRKKKWALEFGSDWMDGMPLTLEQIRTFYDSEDLEAMVEDLVSKGYLKKEHPKKKEGSERVQDTSLPLGYNIVAGKMSFQISKILSPNETAPTLVAMDMEHLYVVDGVGVRKLSLREGLRLFGYPEDYKFDISRDLGYDLLGNTVVVPVIQAVSNRVLSIYKGDVKE